MYTWPNFKTKKALRQAIESEEEVKAWQPGPCAQDTLDGWHCFEGPHYPEPHRWYARGLVENGRVVKIAR